ncbi:MAG: hypothetical protein LUC48_09905 [Clostridiales bacterium]|nr:hypothetical protein [Clostridiales bacterium]
MYTAEYKASFTNDILAFLQQQPLFEGACIVGGGGALWNHTPLCCCLYRADSMAEGEEVLLRFIHDRGSAYVNRQAETENHIKFDVFYENGFNATLHLEVTETFRIKAKHYDVRLDKTGNVAKAAADPADVGKQGAAFRNPPDFDFYAALRTCEQKLLMGEMISADIYLNDARVLLLRRLMKAEGHEMGTHPSFGKLSPESLQAVEETYPAARTEAELVRAAKNALALYEETASRFDGVPVDPKLSYLLYHAFL